MSPNPLPSLISDHQNDTEYCSVILISLEIGGEHLYRQVIAQSIDQSANVLLSRLRHLLNSKNRQAAIDFCAGCHSNGTTDVNTVCSIYDGLFGVEY